MQALLGMLIVPLVLLGLMALAYVFAMLSTAAIVVVTVILAVFCYVADELYDRPPAPRSR